MEDRGREKEKDQRTGVEMEKRHLKECKENRASSGRKN